MMKKQINFPEGIVKLDRMPEDPEGMDIYGFRGPEAAGIIRTWEDSPLGVADKDEVIRGIRSSMQSNQGLIEVETGLTAQGLPFYYSIVKNGIDPHGVAYLLFLRIYGQESDIVIQSQFDEMGMTGQREATVFAYARQQGIVGDNMEGWARDPYDETVTEGMLMNLSEQRALDEAFPNHPLSVIRQLVEYVIAFN